MRIEDKDKPAHTAYAEYEPFDNSAPEKNLLRAVLLSAIGDLQKEGEPRRHATDFFLNSGEDYLFSFRSICGYLNVDSKQVLKVIGLKR
jgi:hypothetical protein